MRAVATEDPFLLGIAEKLSAGRWAAEVWNSEMRLAAVTEDYINVISSGREGIEPGLGERFLSVTTTDLRTTWPGGPTLESLRSFLARCGGGLAAALDGGVAALSEDADPRFADILENLEPDPESPWLLEHRIEVRFGSRTTPIDSIFVRLHRPSDGSFAGFVTIVKPGVSSTVLGMLALGDDRLFERMMTLIQPGRKPGAVLFADLEGSTPLSRRLSSAEYFSLVRRLSMLGDDAVVSAGGIVGKHVGDGFTAFFLAETCATESAAARACIEAARALGELTPQVAARSGLDPDEVSLRFGLHWGASLYVGRLITSGRIEATALGDEVNEGARIEASAPRGRALASKALIERLDAADAEALGLTPGSMHYTPLAELPTATEKARRDAPTLAVTEV